MMNGGIHAPPSQQQNLPPEYYQNNLNNLNYPPAYYGKSDQTEAVFAPGYLKVFFVSVFYISKNT